MTEEVARSKLHDLVDRLSDHSLHAILDYASYLADREGWEATQELLLDPKMRKDIETGLAEIRAGHTVTWEGPGKHVSG